MNFKHPNLTNPYIWWDPSVPLVKEGRVVVSSTGWSFAGAPPARPTQPQPLESNRNCEKPAGFFLAKYLSLASILRPTTHHLFLHGRLWKGAKCYFCLKLIVSQIPPSLPPSSVSNNNFNIRWDQRSAKDQEYIRVNIRSCLLLLSRTHQLAS